MTFKLLLVFPYRIAAASYESGIVSVLLLLLLLLQRFASMATAPTSYHTFASSQVHSGEHKVLADPAA
jgi:hypothetical protein